MHRHHLAPPFFPFCCGSSPIWRASCSALVRLLSLTFSAKTLSLKSFFPIGVRVVPFFRVSVRLSFFFFPFSSQQPPPPPHPRPGPAARVFVPPIPTAPRLAEIRLAFFPAFAAITHDMARCRLFTSVPALCLIVLALCFAWTGASEPVAGASGVLRLYQSDAASYCFVDTRMQGAPLTCVASSYLETADTIGFGPASPQSAIPAPLSLAAMPAHLTAVSPPDAAGDVTVERVCRPDPADGRVMCATVDPSNTTALAAPWVQLVKVGGDARPDLVYPTDAVVIYSTLDEASGACGLVDNVVVCPAPNATVFLVVF